jgi:hypothetical protein
MLAKLLSNVFSSRSIAGVPSLADRMANRANDFELISLLPYTTRTGEINMDAPFKYPATVRPLSEAGPVDRAVWRTGKIACADDICVEGSLARTNIEIRAAGLDYTVPPAIMEAARRKEAAGCRYVIFEHPLHKHLKGLNSIVLENTAAPPSAPGREDKVLVVTMVPHGGD